MLDIDEGVDEDYFVVGRSGAGRGLTIHGIARRPTSWVARHLRRQGAVVSSGIMIGYAGRFAAHIAKHWPEVRRRLTTLVDAAHTDRVECRISSSFHNRQPGAVLKLLRWHPPAFAQRVFTVCDSGWSGLRSPHAVARIAEFIANQIDQREPILGRSAAADTSETVAFLESPNH
jgi:hypothetical protein